jgi:galactose mutarotase-like enzyme
MFTAQRSEGALPTVELVDTSGPSRAVVAPGRGGMVTRFTVAGREVLYLDEKTLLDPSANVRGGNPVLFPSPGKLTGDAWARDDKHGSMKQHGFARNLPWEVVGLGIEGRAEVTLRLRSNEATLAQYPWAFTAEITYAVQGRALRIEVKVANEGAEPMPFGAGFHPYFLVPQEKKAEARIETHATQVFDNVTKRRGPFAGFDLTAPEVDLHLVDHGSTEASLAVKGGPTVRLRGSAEFTHWVVWTLRGRDFVCLEPWTCPGDALNTGDRLMVLPAGAARSVEVEISA